MQLREIPVISNGPTMIFFCISCPPFSYAKAISLWDLKIKRSISENSHVTPSYKGNRVIRIYFVVCLTSPPYELRMTEDKDHVNSFIYPFRTNGLTNLYQIVYRVRSSSSPKSLNVLYQIFRRSVSVC